MTGGEVVALVVLIALSLAVVVWFLANRKHPENASAHDGVSTTDSISTRRDDTPVTASDEFYSGVDRPAGPDAEPMDPDRIGGDHRPPTTG